MMMVDSSVRIDYFNGISTDASDYLDTALGQQNFIIGDLILAEVLQGFRSEKDFNKAKSLLTSLDVHRNLAGNPVLLVPIGHKCWEG